MTDRIIAIYARAFGPRADTSVVVQTDACRRLAARLGCAEPDYFLERHAADCDLGDALDRLLTACTKGRVRAVVAASRDRINPNPAKVDAILARLTTHDVAVHFVDADSEIVADPI